MKKYLTILMSFVSIIILADFMLTILYTAGCRTVFTSYTLISCVTVFNLIFSNVIVIRTFDKLEDREVWTQRVTLLISLTGLVMCILTTINASTPCPQ